MNPDPPLERSSELEQPLLPNDHSSADDDNNNPSDALATTEEGEPDLLSLPSSSSESTSLESTQQPPPPPNPWKNHNVILSLVLCVVAGVADSIWGSVVLSGFLLALANAMGDNKEGNTLVGTAEAVNGLTQLVTALPVGILADNYGKSKVVRLGGGLMLLTIMMTAWALIDIRNHAEENTKSANQSYIVLVVALGLWGVVDGISFGPSQALYSDSIPRGRRSEMLTWLYTCYLLSSAVGPIVSIVLIVTVSSRAEDWSISEIFPVFFIGVCLEVPAAIIMFFFSDKHVVPEGGMEEEEGPPSTASVNTTGGNVDANIDADAAGETQTLPVAEPEQDTANAPYDTLDALASSNQEALLPTPTPTDDEIQPRKSLTKEAIPYVLFLSSLIVSLGSGASVKYFPLFFKEIGFGSAQVQGIFLAVPIFISGFSFVAQETGKRIGRIETTVLFDIIGVTLLFWMTWLSRNVASSWEEHDDDSNAEESLWKKRPHLALFIVTVYLFRTGIMNSSYPLLESILMDSVPSNRRARWKSLESIASFGWTGSALVGGILSDSHSYQFTFAITASMQLCGGLLLLLIRPFVEKEGAPVSN